MSHTAPFANLLPGTQLYKYKLRHRIGGGSFGEVWLAEDQAIGHVYAIKILKPGTPVDHRLREAQIGHILEHNNLVRVHQADVTKISGQDYVIIAMDYMPRGPITKLANPSLFLTMPDVLRLGCDILRGLEYLHSEDFFHNDIKPENVLIGPHGQGMLTDYGIVGVTRNGAPVPPTAFYKIHAAPEVVDQNSISAQTDIFQVGLTLFRMLVGLDVLRHKFNSLGERRYYKAVADADLVTASDFPAYVPLRLRRMILRAVNPDVDERYETALEMRRELEKLSYSGYWTVSAAGAFIGHNGNNEYRYEQKKRLGNRYTVTTYKKNTQSGRETRFAKGSALDLTNAQAKKHIAKFVRSVVEGL